MEFRVISIRDGLDTLEAIKPYGQNAIRAIKHIEEGFLMDLGIK